jgi:hypothetical protein
MTPIQWRAVGLVLVAAAYAGAWAVMAERADRAEVQAAAAPSLVPGVKQVTFGETLTPVHTLHSLRTDHEFRIDLDPSPILETIQSCDWWHLLELGSIRAGTVWAHKDWAIAEVIVERPGYPDVVFGVCLNRSDRKPWTVEQVNDRLPSDAKMPDDF